MLNTQPRYCAVEGRTVLWIVALPTLLTCNKWRSHARVEHMIERRTMAAFATDCHRPKTMLNRSKAAFPSVTRGMAPLTGRIVIDSAVP
jgi:hypothetical protein